MELSFWITNASGRFIFALFSIAGHKEQEPETGTDLYKNVWRYQKWIG